MQPNYDNWEYISTAASYKAVQTGTFTVTVSGTIASGTQQTYTGSSAVSLRTGSVKLYFTQDNVPLTAPLIDYTSSTLIPAPPAGASNGNPIIWVGCTVSGGDPTTEIDVLMNIRMDNTTGISATLYIFNPTLGTMTLTTTTFTFRYTVYAPTYDTL